MDGSAGARWYAAGKAALAAAFAGALALIIALGSGWNSPRPRRPPDWEAEGVPITVTASAGETAVVLLTGPVADFILEVEAQPLAGPEFNGYGLVYRAQGRERYCAFAVGSDGYYAVLRVDEGAAVELSPWQQFPHVRRGREGNRLRVECRGAECRFYINDEYAVAVEERRWGRGGLGLWGRAFDGDAAILFRAVRLWTTDEG